jgi:rod shape determining protein RodA
VQRTTYNLRQSQIAIAAGGLSGRGLFQGSQTNLSFVPEQHTDFIFTAVAEELGFVGAVALLALFGLIVWRTWRAAALSRDRFGTLLCVGVLAMLVFQVFENVGMTMGITPIAGIPLPFMSYGGSATLAGFLALGLVLNVHMRRFA